MSVRYQFSYWLNAKPLNTNAKLDDFIEALNQESLLLPEGYLDATIDPQTGTVSAEVDPKQGTVEEDNDLEDTINRVAAKCPEFEIILKSNNEEDHSESSVTTWANGKNMGTSYARTIEPGELDEVSISVTLRRFIALLKKNDLEWLIPIVEAEFNKKGPM